MQVIKDDMFCTILSITLTIGCLMQLNTSMKKRKTFLSDNIIQSLTLKQKHKFLEFFSRIFIFNIKALRFLEISVRKRFFEPGVRWSLK